MTTKTAATNGMAGDFAGPDIAAIVADPSGSRLDELYAWMDAAKAELGGEDPRVARHDEVFDTAITGLADLVRMSPHDEMERMIAAQLVAAHAATMDCYRRSRTSNLEHRRENLNQANKLTRAFVMLFGALQRNRPKVEERGSRLPRSDIEIPPRVPPRRERVATRDRGAAGEVSIARPKPEKQPHAAEMPHDPMPGTDACERAGTSDAQPCEGLNEKSEKQPYAKEAGAPGAPQIASAIVRDRPWADLARRGEWGAGAKREK